MMNITVNNDFIEVVNPTDDLLSIIVSDLSYKDKSKQYQLKRLSKTAWGRSSPLYKKLQKEVDGKLYIYDNSTNTLKFQSTFYSNYKNELSGAIDNRAATGKTVSFPWAKKPFDLRDYQEEAVNLMDLNYRGLIRLATGLGKTLLAVHAVKRIKKKTLVVCPSDSVAKQFYEELSSAFGSHRVGFYGGGKKKIKDITVGIAASVVRNTEEFKKHDIGLLIMDEVHHCPANTFFDIASALAGVGKIFGLTATDYRSDGKDILITAGVGPVLIDRDIKWGVANGWLAEPCFICREIKTGGKDFKDDKLKSYKEHVLNNQQMKDAILSDAQKMIAAGKATLILVDEVAHGEELSKQLGIPFAQGEDKQSQSYVDDLNDGKIPGLIGTDGKISEGTNTKNVDVLILANFVASKGPVIQAIGRGLRKQGTKTRCIILDYIPVDSTMLKRHGYNRVRYYEEISDKVKVITC